MRNVVSHNLLLPIYSYSNRYPIGSIWSSIVRLPVDFRTLASLVTGVITPIMLTVDSCLSSYYGQVLPQDGQWARNGF